MTLTQTLISHGDTVVVAIVAIVLGFKQFSSGASSLRKEIASDYKERNQQLDEQIKGLEGKHQDTLVKLARLEATLEEKDKHIESLTLLNQGKNPEIIEMLKKISESNSLIVEFMKTMHKVLMESKSELHYQSDILKKGDERNNKIDVATATGEGEPVLLPDNK